MALDEGLLRRAGATGHAAWRAYGWAEPAATFGYTQSWATVSALAAPWGVRLIRRASAGGLVDHRSDLTYALALPRSWPLAQESPIAIYRAVHQALASALATIGSETELSGPATGDRQQCFVAPVCHDLVDAASGRKIAGAALRRSSAGLLLQGSIQLGPPGNPHPGADPHHPTPTAQPTDQASGDSVQTSPSPWPKALQSALSQELCRWLKADLHFADPLDLTSPDVVEDLARYQSASWNEKR